MTVDQLTIYDKRFTKKPQASSFTPQAFSLLNNIQSAKHISLIGLTNGDFIAFDEEEIFTHIVDLVEVHDIGAVHFQEMLLAHLLFQVFYGIVGNVFLVIDRNKFHIVAHTFNIQDGIIIQTDQFAVGFNINMIGCAVGGYGFF